MRARISTVARLCAALLLALVSVVARPDTSLARAGQPDESCATPGPGGSAPLGRPLASVGATLLPADGAGFFRSNTRRVVLHVEATPEAQRAAGEVRDLLVGFYGEDTIEVAVSDDAGATDEDAEATRTVIISGDVGVPGAPAVYRVGGDKTLYLHWATASEDITSLLDVPSFEALAVDPAPATGEMTCATAFGGPAGDTLAYVDPESSTSEVATAPAAPPLRLPDVPLADSTTGEQWPFPVAAAAVLVTAGGVVLHRRDRIFGGRPSDDVVEVLPDVRVSPPVLRKGSTVDLVFGDILDRNPARPGTCQSPAAGPITDTQLNATTVTLAPPTPAHHRNTKSPAAGPITDTQLNATTVTLAPPTTRFPIADRPPATPRVIYLDGDEAAVDQAAAARRAHGAGAGIQSIDLHAKRRESLLARSVERAAAAHRGPVLSRHHFATVINAEWSRHRRGGRDGAVASLVLSELQAVELRLGAHAAEKLFGDVAARIAELARPLDILGMAGDHELALLMPELDEETANKALEKIAKSIAATTFTVGEERVLLTPATGFAMLSDTKNSPDLVRAVEAARAMSMMNLHLFPERWDGETLTDPAADESARIWATVKEKLRTPLQIAATVVIAWVLPFVGYIALDAIGLDVSFVVYLFLVSALVLTGAFILAEGMMAIRQKEPPEEPTVPYPKATALIAAYLPNEAATVIETIEAFFALDYPNDVQIILAYNTPDPLPVEEHLDRLAAEHPNFVPVRIIGSNSKAQNVNAALSMAEGEFIGMFDADHQPRPDAFTRAWRWIDSGYDVVQGHCLTRNGDAGFLAKMIAVEFESIYAVAHPGRAKMHRFGVFGGSNGFWRTELLHETRMRGSMLTEDIDSSMRVVERGFKIRSDRDLVSRELATTTFKQVWNQRMRWAQGWFQVSMEHVKLSFRSKELTIRQKLGLFHLLMWRELYPWLSQQLFPLLAFWAVQAGGIGRLDWTVPIFLATTIFTFSVGPLQTLFAYLLADDEIKQHKKWFWAYLVFTTPFYTEYKNLIARVAHIKQFMGESNWRVTPRSEEPVDEI